ncbi:MAG: hypothetical protein WKF94_05415, partial [Solirubrobacteraceae bacterium]
MAESSATIRLRMLGEREFSRDADKAARGLRGIGDEGERLNRVVGGTRKLVMPAALITGVGLLAQSMSAAAAGGVALTAGVAPAVGALAAVPAIASAVQQGLGAVKLGMAGVTEAVGGLNAKLDPEKLAALTPPARRFARVLQSLKAPVVDIQKRVQRGMFPGMTAGLKAATENLGVFRRGMAATGKSIGMLAERAGKLVGSKGFGRDLEKQMGRNNLTIRRLGGAGIRLGDALRHVVIAAGPLVDWLTRLAAGWSRNIQATAKAGRESGRLAAFFEKTRDVLSRLFSITGAVAKGLLNIGKAGSSLGGDLLASIDGAAGRFAKWTGSMRGQNSLKTWFAEAKPAVYELAKLIGAVGKSFGSLGGGASSLAPMIKQIRTELLPVLTRVISGTTKAFGPTLVSAITNIAAAMEPLFGSSGPMILYVKALSALAKASAWLTNTVPGASAAITVLIGAMAVNKVLAFTKATKVLAAAQWLLNVALRANPIGLVVTALAALGVWLVHLYKKTDAFRTKVDQVWAALKNAGVWAANAGRNIKQFVGGAIDWIRPKIAWLINALKDVVQFATSAIDKARDVTSFIPGQSDGGSGIFPKNSLLGL